MVSNEPVRNECEMMYEIISCLIKGKNASCCLFIMIMSIISVGMVTSLGFLTTRYAAT